MIIKINVIILTSKLKYYIEIKARYVLKYRYNVHGNIFNLELLLQNATGENMLRRFSLYGFSKNQQYYDYFLILAFKQMGLSYFLIGILIAFREIMINIYDKQSSFAR